MGCIYLIQNKMNNKVYIGKTKYTSEIRWKDHVNKSKKYQDFNSKLYRAINKYGEENFSILTLESGLEEPQLSQKEKEYIKFYNSVEDGYNISYGGEGESQVDQEEIIRKFKEGKCISDIAKEVNHTNKTIKKVLEANNLSRTKEEIKNLRLEKIGKKVMYNSKVYNSYTQLALYLKENEEELKNKRLETIIQAISRSIKNDSLYLKKYKFYSI